MMECLSDTFGVVTWNMAMNDDYSSIYKFPHRDCTKSFELDVDTEEGFDALMSKRRNIAEKYLGKHFKQTSLFFLQETQDLIDCFYDDNYCIVSLNRGSERDIGMAAVAFDKRVYELLHSHFPETNKDFGCVVTKSVTLVLRHKPTNQRIIATSAHLTGCYDIHNNMDDATFGNGELVKILKYIEEIAEMWKCSASIIGMDANVAPDHERIKYIKKNNYNVHINSTHTNYCFGEKARGTENDVFRTIDYIACKMFKRSIHKFNFREMICEDSKLCTDFELGTIDNPSDHTLVGVTFSLEKLPSIWEKVVNKATQWMISLPFE